MRDRSPLPADPTRGRPRTVLSVLLVVAGLGLVADQAGKWWAFARPSEAASLREIAPGVLAGAQGRNYGGMYSLDGAESFSGYRIVLTVVGFAAISMLLRGVVVDRDRWRAIHAVGGGLVLAGAVGNQVDRLVLGYVRDFLVLRSMPHGIFNPADVFMVLGALLLVATWSARRRPAPALLGGAASADGGQLIVAGSVSTTGA